MDDAMSERTSIPVENFKPKVREAVPRVSIVNMVSLQGCPGHGPKSFPFRTAFKAGNGQPYERWPEDINDQQDLCPGCWIETPSVVIVENRGISDLFVTDVGRVPPGRHVQFFPPSTRGLGIFGNNGQALVVILP